MKKMNMILKFHLQIGDSFGYMEPNRPWVYRSYHTQWHSHTTHEYYGINTYFTLLIFSLGK